MRAAEILGTANKLRTPAKPRCAITTATAAIVLFPATLSDGLNLPTGQKNKVFAIFQKLTVESLQALMPNIFKNWRKKAKLLFRQHRTAFLP